MKISINDSNWQTITSLMDTFEEVSFNPEGELVATRAETVPVFGDIVVSFVPSEQHFMIYPEEGGPAKKHFSGTIEWDHLSECWRELQPLVLEALRDAVVNQL